MCVYLEKFKRAKGGRRIRRPRRTHMEKVTPAHTACGAIVIRLSLAFSHMEREKKRTADFYCTYQPEPPAQLADKTNNI